MLKKVGNSSSFFEKRRGSTEVAGVRRGGWGKSKGNNTEINFYFSIITTVVLIPAGKSQTLLGPQQSWGLRLAPVTSLINYFSKKCNLWASGIAPLKT